VRWAADDAVYLLTDWDRDTTGLARLDVDTGQVMYLAGHPGEPESLAVSPDARRLAYTVNTDGYAQLYVHDLEIGTSTTVQGLPAGVVAEPIFASDGTRVAVSVQSPRHNLDIWIVDLGTLDCQQLTQSSLAGIPRDSLVVPDLIHHNTFDGHNIPALFYRPVEAEPPLPVILYVHGGPASQTRPDFDPRFQFFLSQGYAILAPNARGSSGYGKTYMALDDVHLRMDAVADLKYAVEWLRASGVADPNRIAIYGRSYGGFMVLAAITTYPELWAAAIDVVGIANWITFLENTGPWRRAHREQEYGSLEQDRAFLETISPIHQVDRIQAPLLVVHGANDPRVPVTEADEIVAHLRSRGHPVQYLRYSDEGHKISKLVNRVDSFTRMAEFLARYL
jgi:dipeptidyl aminopeptidase/acylaminoacyl peptidase